MLNAKATGKRIKKEITKKNITNKALAQRLNVTEQAIWKYTTGKMMPKLDVFYNLCKELNVSPDKLLGIRR